MKAAVVQKPELAETCEVERPVVEPGEVLVRVAYCGVCGSDVPRVWMGTAHSYPIVLGHEFSGTIVEVGDGVDDALVGKRVAGVPLVPCHECDDCAVGDYSLCKHYSFIGSRRPGAFAEFVAVPAENVFLLPDDVSYLNGAFFEPATVALHALRLVGKLRWGSDAAADQAGASGPAWFDVFRGKSSAVVGSGTIGIFVAQALQAAGANVVLLGRREEPLAVAREAGVQKTALTCDEDWPSEAKFAFAPAGFDFVFDATGNARVMPRAVELAANHGRVCMVGTPKTNMEFTPRLWEEINRKELFLTGSWMSYSSPWPGEEWPLAAQLFAEGAMKVTDAMIDAIYPLDEASAAFARFAPNANKRASGKILIDCR